MPSPQGRHFGMLSQSKFFAVFLVILIKAVRADFDEAVYIFMRIKAVRLKLNESNGDVRAVVGNSILSVSAEKTQHPFCTSNINIFASFCQALSI